MFDRKDVKIVEKIEISVNSLRKVFKFFWILLDKKFLKENVEKLLTKAKICVILKWS